MMSRYEFAAMLYRALEKGVKLDHKLVREFELKWAASMLPVFPVRMATEERLNVYAYTAATIVTTTAAS